MTGLDAVSRASYLTKENLFLSQFGPRGARGSPPAPLARQRRQGPLARDRRQAPLHGTTGLDGTAKEHHKHGSAARTAPQKHHPQQHEQRHRSTTRTTAHRPTCPGGRRRTATTNQSTRPAPAPRRPAHAYRAHTTARACPFTGTYGTYEAYEAQDAQSAPEGTGPDATGVQGTALSDESAQAQQGFGPAIPSPAASVALRPLGRDSVTITSGLLHQWQERNRSASLPLALRQLETAGNLANLRLAIGTGSGKYQGPQFMDSDLYKTLEAIAWEVARVPSEPLARFAAAGDRPAGGRAAAGRLPELLRPGHRQAPVREPRLQPRAVLRGPPHPGGCRGPAQPPGRRRRGERGPVRGGPAVRRPPGQGVPRHPRRPRRPPHSGDRPGRAVPGDRPRRVPAAGRPVLRAARPRPDRRLRLRQPVPAGSPAGARGEPAVRARGARAVPGGRGGRPRDRDR